MAYEDGIPTTEPIDSPEPVADILPADEMDWRKPTSWRGEVERSRRFAETYWPEWQTNLNYYVGESPDVADAQTNSENWVNINADFYNTELKVAQLFYDTPTLTLTSKGEFAPQRPAASIPGQPPQPPPDASPIVSAHRDLLNELLGPNHANVLPTVQKAIKDCILTAGVGATKIGYYASMQDVPGMLGQQMPVDECWYWERVPSKKFRIPADFRDSDFDKAAWLGMEFRVPLADARRQFNLPPDYKGIAAVDDKVLSTETRVNDDSNVPYVDGVEIWYKAAIFDQDAVHPKLIRRHILVEGLEEFVEKTTDSPYHTLLPTGRMSADSMNGYPIHILTLRDVPDNAFIPSDAKMARPLVRELCKFRTQQVQERDANLPRFLIDSSKLPPETVTKIMEGTIGAMIPVEEGAIANGAQSVIAQVTQGSVTRGSYAANDYIQRDLDKTSGIDAVGAGIKAEGSPTATEISVVDKQRNVRLDAERRRALAWYIKGVEKFSALIAKFMTPQLAIPYIGSQSAQAWAMWDKQAWDGRFVFGAKPDSQIKLDAAAERKFALDMYQFLARDPNVDRKALLRNLLEKANLDPAEILVTPPPKVDQPNVNFAFKGEDLISPQAQQVREILAQAGIRISQEAIQASATQLFQQMTLGIRDANGKAVTATQQQPGHPGAVEKERPLSQSQADQSGQRSGPKSKAQ